MHVCIGPSGFNSCMPLGSAWLSGKRSDAIRQVVRHLFYLVFRLSEFPLSKGGNSVTQHLDDE